MATSDEEYHSVHDGPAIDAAISDILDGRVEGAARRAEAAATSAERSASSILGAVEESGKNAAIAQESAAGALGSEAASVSAAVTAEAAADRAMAEADRATVPPVKGVYNIILPDRATGERYALVVEDGVLALLGVKETMEATEALHLIDAAGGHVYTLAVEAGELMMEEVS